MIKSESANTHDRSSRLQSFARMREKIRAVDVVNAIVKADNLWMAYEECYREYQRAKKPRK